MPKRRELREAPHPVRAIALAAAVLLAVLALSPPAAMAHGGGLDSNGGHHCREAGYRSGKCSPLNSYHCHRPGCVLPGGQSGPGTIPTTSSLPRPSSTTSTTTTTPTTTTTTPTTTTTMAMTSTTSPPSTTSTETPPAPPPELADAEGGGGDSNPLVTLTLVGAIGYGGYRLAKRKSDSKEHPTDAF